MLRVTADDVATYAPGTPEVTQQQVEQAVDWAEAQLERAGVTVVKGSRAYRQAVRAVCAYTLSLLPGVTALVDVTDTQRLESLQEGTDKFVFAERSSSAVADAAAIWEARAWEHLTAAGLPRPRLSAGAAR